MGEGLGNVRNQRKSDLALALVTPPPSLQASEHKGT